MKMTSYHVKATFITEVLGTQPQKDVASEYIAKKFEDNGGELPADEAETLPEKLEKGTTVFHKVDGQPVLWDYQCKGFIKEAGSVFNGLHGVKALRSKIDNLLFIRQRMISLHLPEGYEIEYLERPLRANTAQGPRVSLARSEMLPAGTWFEFDIDLYDGPITEEIIRDLFSYGQHKGMLQWRNGGFGKVSFDITKTS